MLMVSKVLLVVAGVLLVMDAILLATGTPNLIPSWPLPCPLTLAALGLVIILFVFSSRACQNI